ncbi:MAG: hypothetical protein ABSG45_08800 [Nitrososphaerales archaeon]|jgi:hypothetical protein
MVSRVLLLSAAIVVVLGAAIYVPAMIQSPPSRSTVSTATTATTCTTSGSTTAESTTQSATTSTTSTTLTTTSTTAPTSATTPSNATNGKFSFSPTSPVKIESVQAVTAKDSHGNTSVTFQVLFENTGSTPIYVIGGCGGGLSSSIVGNSMVIQRVPGGPLCDCPAIILTLNDGQNHTSVNPGCWSGYAYHLLSPGTVTMNMTLQWSSSVQGLESTNSTSIQVGFTFP